VWPNERVVKFVTDHFIPVRVHVRDHKDEFKRLGERYGAQWTPTILMLHPDGKELFRIEGFLPLQDFLTQLELGLAHAAFAREDWKEAERHFSEVVKQSKEDGAGPEALYWAGVARYKATQDPSALTETAHAFEKRYSDSLWAKKASVWK